ncbi:hypothetical protein M0R45_011363 [Rubus argutus]|uniref:Uncharacterized protein n=1 Tax=Rubus argutus TaxID=59490 RepID=A0AAW1YCE4_RUBAR
MSSLSLPRGLRRLGFPSLHAFNISDRRGLLTLPSKDFVEVPHSGLHIFADACRRSILVNSFAVSSCALLAMPLFSFVPGMKGFGSNLGMGGRTDPWAPIISASRIRADPAIVGLRPKRGRLKLLSEFGFSRRLPLFLGESCWLWDPGLRCLTRTGYRQKVGCDGAGSACREMWVIDKVCGLTGGSSVWMLGGPSSFAVSGISASAAWRRSARVWPQSWLSLLGLDRIGWIVLVMFGFGFWFRIWDPGELLLTLSSEVLWNWYLVLWFFGNEGRRFPYIRRLFLRGVCMVGQTTGYFDGRFPSVRRTWLRGICMVGHTIGYFLITWLTSGLVDALLHPVTSSIAFSFFIFDVVSTSINCTFF